MKWGLKVFSLCLRRWLPVVLWAGLVLYASTSAGSGNHSARFLRPLLAWVFPDLASTSLTEINFFTRKTAHVVQFVLYALLLWRGLVLPPALRTGTRALVGWVLGTAAVLAVLSEGVQLFSPQRSAQVTDVLLDISGAAVGVGLILGFRLLFRGRNMPARHSPPSPARIAGKILITSDLHLDECPDGGREVLDRLKSAVSGSQADVLLVAGDFGVAERAGEWMAGLREAAGPETEIVICLGNHDHWLGQERGACATPEEVREKFWRPACLARRVQCLDFENVVLPGITLCGGYAHYDFGFRDPEIMVDGESPTIADYRKGRFAGMEYPDGDRIPGLDSAEESGKQALAISRRLSLACESGAPVLFATHTVPFSKLAGQGAPRGSLKRFFDAYSGNSAIGSLLSALAPSVALAVCGHTHRSTPILRIHGIPCINTGSGPEQLRFHLFDLETLSVSKYEPELQETEAGGFVA
ncbi:MAG: VanZ family protein [Terrimicrobiaceae bacterium]